MTRIFLALAIVSASLIAQSAQPRASAEPPPSEEDALRRAVSEGATSSIDMIRVLESHLVKFPGSDHKRDIERTIFKAAIEGRDDRRIAAYGQRILAAEPDDLLSLDRTTRALLKDGSAEASKAALKFSRHYETLLRKILEQPEENTADRARRNDEIGKAIARALLSQAIATGNLGDPAAAAELAGRSFAAVPTPDAAAELARRAAQSGKPEAAVEAYADAFALAEGEAERAIIRKRMGEIYAAKHGSETGLGDIVLKAFDRTAALNASRQASLRAIDPNTGMSDPMEFTLTGVSGKRLSLASLKGKAVILDFWATWCGPCRAQHPLYEKVKQRFASRDDVVFLAINTDEDRDLVKPFLAEQGWSPANVYYEDGLSRLLRVSSIPTTVVFGRGGAITSRMNGYDPARFVDTLSARIEEALK